MVRRETRALIGLAVAIASLGFAPAATAGGSKNLFGVSSVTYPGPTDFQRIAQGGVRSLRVQFNWNDVEPAAGVRRWDVPDAIVAESARTGVELLPLLYGTPGWVSPGYTSPPIYTAQARGAWPTFVADLARRYGSNGSFWALHPELPRLPITDWQVWNEVNLTYYWGAKPNPRAYADLLRLTRGALRAGDPSSKLILAGLIPFKTTGAGSVGGGRYLQRLFKIKGIRKQFDAVAVHPYGSSPRIVIKALEQTRQLLNRLGARRVPLWVTEFGWSTGGSGWSSSPFRASPAGQAQKIRETYGRMQKGRKRLRLQRAFYFSLFDFDQAGIEDDWTARMGLFDVSRQPKPAWFAYARQAGGSP